MNERRAAVLMVKFRCFLVALLVLVSGWSLAQEKTKVKGTITDAQTGEPLPFVNVAFVGKNVGTTTDFNGKYQMDTKWGSDKVVASFMGYEAVEKDVTQGQNNTVDFQLEPTQIKLQEVTVQAKKGRYKNKDNPAVELIKKVVEKKEGNRKEGFEHYEYDKYEKLQLDINNITEKFMDRKMFKKFEFMWQYVDTSTVNGKPYLPLYFTETKSKVYLRSNPKDRKEVTYGLKTVGFEDFMDEEGIDYFMEKIYQDIDIYDNTILLMEKQFKSPISIIAPVSYKYFLLDTIDLGGVPCAHMKFQPRNPADLAFRGDMWVALDSSYAVKKVTMTITRSANINFVSALEIDQEFDYSDSLKWHIVKDQMTIDYNLLTNNMGMYGKKTVTYRDIKINEPAPDSIWSDPGRIVINEDAKEKGAEFWEQERHEDLNKNEQGVYDMTKEMKELPAFKRAMNILFLLISGYYEVGPVDIGPLYNIVSLNSVEHWRFRLSVRTNKKFSEKWGLTTYLAYGLDDRKDRRWKGGGGVTYFIKQRPYHQITAEFQRDIQMPGQALLLASDDNIFLSLRRGVANLMIYYDSYRLNYWKEWDFGLGFGINAEHRRRQVAGALTFDPIDQSISDPKEVVTNEVGLTLRYSPNLKYYEGRSSRVPMRNKYPIIDLSYTYSIPDLLGADYEYHKIGVRIQKRFYLSPIGYGDSQWEGGYIIGRVPFPLLFIHRGNQTFFHDPNTFNMMNWFEFVSDKYISLDYYHHFNGFVFNKIPFLKKLKWRMTTGVKAVWGGVSVSNTPGLTESPRIFNYPTRRIDDEDGKPVLDQFGNEQYEQVTFTLERMPYIEASVGIENI
ncbi:MAG: carboxypeptidase-like regulatory domain-containing protein, partial [Flavobacteriales bacterium]|nr:carboxypeptidase-like regulatory domain-containing protein [Flavobacteriales bacterium]